MSKEKFQYEGRDLEAMDFAVKYHEWILDILEPYLGQTIVEVGAGSGSFTRLLLRNKPKRIIAVEPSEDMFPLLERTCKDIAKEVKSTPLKGFFCDKSADVKKAKPTSAVYINVFEHIEKDEEELRLLFDTLPSGGKVCIFVPANKWLMSDFDRKIGHFRRYSKGELERKVQAAGFEVLHLRYFDAIGILPWLVKFRLMRSTDMEPGLTRLYDKVVVPVEKRLEKILPPIIGKNLVLVAEKK